MFFAGQFVISFEVIHLVQSPIATRYEVFNALFSISVAYTAKMHSCYFMENLALFSFNPPMQNTLEQ